MYNFKGYVYFSYEFPGPVFDPFFAWPAVRLVVLPEKTHAVSGFLAVSFFRLERMKNSVPVERRNGFIQKNGNYHSSESEKRDGQKCRNSVGFLWDDPCRRAARIGKLVRKVESREQQWTRVYVNINEPKNVPLHYIYILYIFFKIDYQFI